jgi:hypothetical protein
VFWHTEWGAGRKIITRFSGNRDHARLLVVSIQAVAATRLIKIPPLVLDNFEYRANFRRSECLYTERQQSTTSVAVFPVSRLENSGKMDVQLNANVEDQDRAECGKDEAGWMKSSGYRARKHVGNRAADNRSDDAEDDCPENRHVHVHHRFRDKPSNQPNKNVPD